jgi:Xaa-Pro dipeptidase
MSSSYAEHLKIVQSRWEAALAAQSLDATLVAAGTAHGYFLDDQSAPFRPNPHFRQWLPFGDTEHCLLLVRPGHQPRVYFFQPRDFWHLPPAVPAEASGLLDVEVFDDRAQLVKRALGDLTRHNRTAFVGEAMPHESGDVPMNPGPLLDHLHYHRALKTPFEIECLTRATERGVNGHLAAERAFADGGSEYQIHMAYLRASDQNESALPYRNIVAINRHAGTLHYQHYDRVHPFPAHSMLIDAGASHLGYGSDITRTYAAADLAVSAPADEPGRVFSGLIRALDERQRQLIAFVKPGLYFPALQEQAHRDIGDLLAEFGLVSCSGADAFENRITDAFFPHGLGHLLGIQTHDVGGHLSSPSGGTRPPDARYPSLRLTRPLEQDMVLTIEPGIYFIPMLLQSLREDYRAGAVNWPLVDALLPYGGIRIEDNVVVTADAAVNVTRETFAAGQAAVDLA